MMNLKIVIICFFSSLFFSFKLFSQNNYQIKGFSDVKLGAYYFDGWTGAYPYHITPELVNCFSERESKWGWITSTQKIMDEQINLAANAGLSFFSFCWYYTGEMNYKNEPLNRSLSFYLNSSEAKKMQYNLLVANHGGAAIGPSDWKVVCDEWTTQFKSACYLKVDGKPFILFFSLDSLLEKFKTIDNVKAALNELRLKAINEGFKGVTIGVTIGESEKNIQLAESCGFDILTGYNYHRLGLVGEKREIMIDNMQKSELDIWNQFPKLTKLPYIPVTTLNWDPRPWANKTNKFDEEPYFVGFSEASVYKSILSCKKWIELNSKNTVKEKIGLIYAWNEYGEGAYLTPTKKGINPLNGVKKALIE